MGITVVRTMNIGTFEEPCLWSATMYEAKSIKDAHDWIKKQPMYLQIQLSVKQVVK